MPVDLDDRPTSSASTTTGCWRPGAGRGGIRQSPIVAAVDDAGLIVISSRETAYKVRYLRADPRAHACLLTDRFFGPWVWVEGTAEILSLPGAMEPLVDYRRRFADAGGIDWDDYRRGWSASGGC